MPGNSLLVVLALLYLCPAAPANSLSLTEEGIAIDDGARGSIILRYPRPCDAKRNPLKIAEKVIDGQTATLKFEGGGTSVVDISSGAIVVKSTDVPAGTKHFQTVFTLPISIADNGATWSSGDDDTPFLKERAPKPALYSGNSRTMTIKTAAGGRVALTVPQYGYHQLHDNRHYNDAKVFQWTAWINHYPDAGSFTIQAGDAPAAKPKAAEPKPAAPAAPAAPKAGKPEMLQPVEAYQLKSADGTDVLKWKDGKKAPFYLAFDDACPTQLKNVIPELEQRKMVGTFYVNPGNGHFRDQVKWTEAAKSPYVVLANHTLHHTGSATLEAFEQDLVKTNELLNQRLPQFKSPRLISYGKPGGKLTWGEGVTDETMKPVLAKLYLINRLPFYGAHPTMHVKNLDEAKKWIDGTIKKGELGHLDFHGIGGDWLPTPVEFFTGILDLLEARRDVLWIVDHATAAKYATERKTAELKVISKDDAAIKLTLTTQADPAIYDLPLTLATKVPAAWKRVLVAQGESKATVDVKEGVAMYDAMPNGVEIVLTPAP